MVQNVDLFMPTAPTKPHPLKGAAGISMAAKIITVAVLYLSSDKV